MYFISIRHETIYLNGSKIESSLLYRIWVYADDKCLKRMPFVFFFFVFLIQPAITFVISKIMKHDNH